MSRKSLACSFETLSLMFDMLYSPTIIPSTCSPNSSRIVRESSGTVSGCSRLATRMTSCSSAATVELRPSPTSLATIKATATAWSIIGVPS